MGLFRNHKTKKERRPRSLFQSLCVSMASIVLSLVMLVGTTMAWFSDSVTTRAATIVAGNTGDWDNTTFYTVPSTTQATGYALQSSPSPVWTSLSGVNSETTLFDTGTPFTPGVAQTVCLCLNNDGTLKTRYRVSLQLVGESGDLSRQLTYGYKVFATQEEVDNFCGTADRALDSVYDKFDSLALHKQDAYAAQDTTCAVELEPGASQYVALSLYMPATTAASAFTPDASVTVQLTLITTQIGEEGTVPEAWDGVTATATEALQKPAENTYVVASPADLAGVANILRQNALPSVTIELTADLDMNNQPWTPIDTAIPVTIQGNGHTICNLNASGENAGLFGSANNTLTVDALKLIGGQVVGTNAAGMLAGVVTGGATLTAVQVENVTVQAPSGCAKPMVGVGAAVENNCNASNYTTGVPTQGGQTQ